MHPENGYQPSGRSPAASLNYLNLIGLPECAELEGRGDDGRVLVHEVHQPQLQGLDTQL